MTKKSDDTLKQARGISIGTAPSLFKNSLSRKDKLDFYRFERSAASSFNLALTGLKANADVALLDAAGKELIQSRRPKKQSEAIAINLTAGTYYIRVALKDKLKTKYQLQVSAALSPIPTPDTILTPASKKFQQIWLKQFGTVSDDAAFAVTVDKNQGVYIAGSTDGALDGNNLGSLDAFVTKYSSDGNLQWSRQTGSKFRDAFTDIEVDSSENIYAVGTVFLPDSLAAIGNDGDAYFVKYSSSGNFLFDKGFDVGNGSSELGYGVALSSDSTIYEVGAVTALGSDAFIAQYNSSGILNNQRQLNLTGEGLATGVTTDAQGYLYVTGITNAKLVFNPNNPISGGDIFLAKYDSSGQTVWFKTLATDKTDVASRVAVDAAGNIYVAGSTSGSLPGSVNQGDIDPFLAKYGGDSSLQWVKQFGSSGTDSAETLAIDAAGRIYVAGSTSSSLFGNSSAGGTDAWIALFDSNGTVVTSTQFGTAKTERLTDIALDQAGNLYAVGTTEGNLGGTNLGAGDAWIAKYSPVPL